jgi:hypothetical protein
MDENFMIVTYMIGKNRLLYERINNGKYIDEYSFQVLCSY